MAEVEHHHCPYVYPEPEPPEALGFGIAEVVDKC